MMIELVAYGAFFLTMALTYAIICLGLNVQWGQTGLFNVGVAGFVGDRRLCLGPPDHARRSRPLRRLRPADRRRLARRRCWRRRSPRCWSALLTLRLRADYLAITTFGVAVVVQLVRAQRSAADRRALRHRLHPAALRLRWPDDRLLFGLAQSRRSSPLVVLGVYLALERLLRSPWGRVLRAIREDEQAAAGARQERLRASGCRPSPSAARIMGLAGAVQAHFIGFIAPENYRADADLPGLGHADRRRLRQQPRRGARRRPRLGASGPPPPR